MSATAMPAQRAAIPKQTHHHRKQPHPVMPNRSVYVPWCEPMSIRQANMLFEAAVLPDLVQRLERKFRNLADEDREEAVQDCVCQAFEAYRALKLYMAGDGSTHLVNVSAALAEHVAAQYLVGIRFANQRSESYL